MTAQIPEQLILNAKRECMHACPPIPNDSALVAELSEEEAYEAAKGQEFGRYLFTSACWRKYVGTWEIKDGKFYLIKLEGKYKLLKDEPVHATWVTGTIVVPQGEMVHYIHMGFSSIYEKELHIKIEAGMVVEQKVIDNADKIKEYSESGGFWF